MGKVRGMASRRVAYPVVVASPSVFIVNVSPPSNRIVAGFPSADTSMVFARFHLCGPGVGLLLLPVPNRLFVAKAIQSGWNGFQLTFIASILVRWHANTTHTYINMLICTRRTHTHQHSHLHFWTSYTYASEHIYSIMWHTQNTNQYNYT